MWIRIPVRLPKVNAVFRSHDARAGTSRQVLPLLTEVAFSLQTGISKAVETEE